VSAASADESDPAQLEPRRRLQAAKERLIELEAQLARYQELVARAAADEQTLASELSAAERDCATLGRELEQDRQRALELDGQITDTLDRVRSSCAELDSIRRSADQESQRGRALERRLATTRQRLGLARQTLGELVQTVVRLGYRLERQSSRPSA
jgi:chromosome segregation ATPase